MTVFFRPVPRPARSATSCVPASPLMRRRPLSRWHGTLQGALSRLPRGCRCEGSDFRRRTDWYLRRWSSVSDAGGQLHQTGDVSYWQVQNHLVSSSGPAQDLVHHVRALAGPPGQTIDIGGTAANIVDQKHSIGSSLPIAIAIMVVATFLMLFLFTGSVLIPLKAIVLNAFTLFAVLGLMVWIFQGGHLSGLLGFTPTPTSTTMPPLLFVIAFAISMDYEVFLISRIKELHDQGATNTEAVTGGLARTGRIVSTAAALLSVTFFAFGLSKISFIQFFGIGTGVAIVIDATMVRGVLVPAVMGLVGERIWWAPGPLRRFHDRFGMHESPELAIVEDREPELVGS